MIKTTTVIPVFNEEESIRKTVEELRKTIDPSRYENEIIIVNDGSTDNTKMAAEATGVRVISHPVNRGYGTALLTGIEASSSDYIIMTDADGSYPISEIPGMIDFAEKFDMVIGMRTGKEYWGTIIKHPARIFFLWLAEYTAGVKIPDVNSGLRVFRKSAFKKISLPVLCRGFSFSTTMTLSFILSGLTVKYVPIKYLSRTGHSKVRFLRDTLRTLQAVTEVIVYYNPLKLAILLACIPLMASIVLIAWALVSGSAIIMVGSLVSLYFFLLLFMFGLLLDLQRMNRG